eukprot:9381315-Alexandrium_andersonii.AAC.1
MSASLVGSEMCIRDRSQRTWSKEGMVSRPQSGQARGGGEPPHVTAAVAVSYTHLTLPTICSV